MDYKELTQDLCSVYSQTGHGGADEIASICRKVLPETAELQRRPSASIGYGDDLFFTQEVPGEKKRSSSLGITIPSQLLATGKQKK